MLSVPVRGDGTIDDHEVAFLEGMAEWMKTNGEGIFGSRPWKVYGEGPSTVETPEAGQFGGARDVRSKPYTIEDIRFTNKGNTPTPTCSRRSRRRRPSSRAWQRTRQTPAGGKLRT